MKLNLFLDTKDVRAHSRTYPMMDITTTYINKVGELHDIVMLKRGDSEGKKRKYKEVCESYEDAIDLIKEGRERLRFEERRLRLIQRSGKVLGESERPHVNKPFWLEVYHSQKEKEKEKEVEDTTPPPTVVEEVFESNKVDICLVCLKECDGSLICPTCSDSTSSLLDLLDGDKENNAPPPPTSPDMENFVHHPTTGSSEESKGKEVNRFNINGGSFTQPKDASLRFTFR